MNPIEWQATAKVSRVAGGDFDFGAVVERSADGKVVAFGGSLDVFDCKAAMTPSANVTAALEAGISGNDAKLTIGATFTTGIAAYRDITELDLSSYSYICWYAKSDITVAAGALRLAISETIALGGSPQYHAFPAMVAGVWQYCCVVFGGAGSTRNAVLSVGLDVVTDSGAQIVYLSDIKAGLVANYGPDGLAMDDATKDSWSAGDDLVVMARGMGQGNLVAGITCVSGQRLYVVTDGELSTTVVTQNGPAIYAAEDQATAGGQVAVIVG